MNSNLGGQLSQLRKQYSELHLQFHGHAPPSASTSTPNDPSLISDFAAAQRKPSSPTGAPASKSVRFRDEASSTEEDANRAALFPYRDEPEEPGVDVNQLDNQQIHAYHREVIAEQDEQLDMLGRSIGRQRELTMAIGDELDSHILLLDDVEDGVDRHQTRLDGARRKLDDVARKARDNWSMTTIIVLIVILVLLIVIFK